jgi:sugar phosphate isomerase/epimerase
MSDLKQPTQPFPPLDTGYKNRFPFTLACPSFVYPAGYVDNARHLAPFVDEIQLLFFESQTPESLPSQGLIRELAGLAGSEKLTYNIHLPSDIYPGHPDPAERRRAADVVRKILECCEPLAPSTYTLHLNRNPEDLPALSAARWQDYLVDTLFWMLPSNTNRRMISVETLDYPFELVAPVIAESNLSVCMDMGHLMVHGVDISAFFDNWKDRITIVHLHGVNGATDHLPLDRLSKDLMQTVLKILRSFSGVVSLEVYSYASLNASLAHLGRQWQKGFL